MNIPDTFLFFDLIGFLLSVSSISIVAHASSLLYGPLRKGMLSFLWGLVFVCFSFVWSIIFKISAPDLPDIQSLILALGMILILFSTQRLFGIYRAQNVN